MNSNQQTLRMRGLPLGVDEDDIVQFFGDRIRKSPGKKIVRSIGPLYYDGNTASVSTTVTFSSHNTAQKALQLDRHQRTFRKFHCVELDHEFKDITILHSSNNPQTGRPDVDIIALHGLTGHAWNTFTKSELLDHDAGYTEEINWLRDLLPDLLLADGSVHYRILTFGYDAEVWMSKSISDINTHVGNLLQYLEVERKDDPERPILFIGHSLGGLVIKQAIATWADEAIAKAIPKHEGEAGEQYIFPVAGCILFGVPNRGTNTANTISGFLSLLSTVFNVNSGTVTHLQDKSHHLMDISSRFRTIQKDKKFPVLSMFETEKWSKTVGLIVDPDSAIFDYQGKPNPFGIQKNHRDMVKFGHKSDHGLPPACHFLTTEASRAVRMRQAQELSVESLQLSTKPMNLVSRGQEDKLAILKACDTVFLVDDSPSMRKSWSDVLKLLQYATNKATLYDTDGIDVHFMNDMESNTDRVRSYTRASEILRKVDLNGSTPLYSSLCRHLDYFLHCFDKRGKQPDFKNYNLIILTDGEPDHESEDEDEISDMEDAEQKKGAFRLIRKKIVETAQILDGERARKDQLGIQFCQIGSDEGAKQFFEYLDNDIKKNHKLKRDMVDTVRCESTLDITPEFLQKLLIGAISRSEDKKTLRSNSNPKSASPPSSSSQTFPLAHSTSSASYPSSLRAPGRTFTGDTLVSPTHQQVAYNTNDDNNIGLATVQEVPQQVQGTFGSSSPPPSQPLGRKLSRTSRQHTMSHFPPSSSSANASSTSQVSDFTTPMRRSQTFGKHSYG